MEKRRRTGRPTTAPVEGQKSTLSIRASANLKRNLQSAAEANARSLSQEAELRLEQSFDCDAVDERLARLEKTQASILIGLAALLAQSGGNTEAAATVLAEADAIDDRRREEGTRH